MIDPDGRVWRVDYFVNGVPSYTSTQHPFSWPIGGVLAGTYHVQAVAYDDANEYTISATSTVTVCGPPSPPATVSGYASGGVVYITWNAAPVATGYQVEAGTAPGLTNVGAWGTAGTSFSGAAPAGTYYVRVRSLHTTCGVGSPSGDIVIQVP